MLKKIEGANPVVSIIMPVYNAEATVGRMVESILNQTFTDWELIAVDDGSTDRSGAILDGYAARRGGVWRPHVRMVETMRAAYTPYMPIRMTGWSRRCWPTWWHVPWIPARTLLLWTIMLTGTAVRHNVYASGRHRLCRLRCFVRFMPKTFLEVFVIN